MAANYAEKFHSRYPWGFDPRETIGAFPKEPVDYDTRAQMEVVTVRRGGSCNPFMIEVERRRKCKITGPPGCGKSSKCVAAAAHGLKRLIVHLVPHPRLVDEFVKRGYEGCEVKTDVTPLLLGSCSVRKPTVLVATYTSLLALCLQEAYTLKDLSGHPLYYCDEFHDSDAATYVVVRQLMAKADKHSAVFVSATLDSVSLAPIEVDDPIIDEIVPVPKTQTEFCDSVRDSLTKFEACKGVLCYSDAGSVDHVKLKTVVEQIGYRWHRLHSRSSAREFLLAKNSLLTGERTFLSADSSYRSGFDLPVSMVIDSCRVSFSSLRLPEKTTARAAFGFELYQSRGRLGRVDLPYQSPLVFRKFSSQFSNDVAIIEGYEAVLAAHVIHAFGGKIPHELAGVGISDDAKYLGDYKLLDSDVNLTTDKLTYPRSTIPPVRGSSGAHTGSRVGSYPDPMEMFAKLNIKPKVAFKVPVKIGAMLHVADPVDTANCVTRTFPRGAESVMNCLEHGPGLSRVLNTMAHEDVSLVATVLFEKLNNLSCEYHAAGAFTELLALETNSSLNPVQTRWLADLHNTTGLKVSEYSARAHDLQILADKSMIDISTVPVEEYQDVIASLTTTLQMVFNHQCSRFHSHSAIADRSRQQYLGGLNVNSGYDAMGRPVLDSKPQENTRILEEVKAESKSKPVKQSTRGITASTSRSAMRPSVTNPDHSVTSFELQLHHPNEEHMRRIYPNAQFTVHPIRQEYDSRRAARSGASASSGGSWSLGGSNSKTRARTWHPPD